MYGSLFPLVDWIVENWWFLLYEPARASELRSGRSIATLTKQRPWVQRHNILNAREGGALPDVTLFRDGDAVAIVWAPDPEGRLENPLRFVGQGNLRLTPQSVRESLQGFVESVLGRMEGLKAPDVDRLRSNWDAIREADAGERELCAWAATLGLDPYDSDDLSAQLIGLLRNRLPSLQEAIRRDLLEASAVSTLADTFDWVNEALHHVNRGASADPLEALPSPERPSPLAHLFGYTQASHFREAFGIPTEPIDNLEAMLRDKCGWPLKSRISTPASPDRQLLLIVGADSDGVPTFVGPDMVQQNDRFRIGRATYFGLLRGQGPRLVTQAHSWDQRASRAFSAELLAPSTSLARRVGDAVSEEDLEALATEFDVSSWVIRHQIVNHHLAWVETP